MRGLHGANRLGGNSLAEIIIFGKRAGLASADYSTKLTSQVISKEVIELAHKNIDKFIKSGNESVRPLQHQLRLIMWKYCGVIKNEKLLKEGLEKILIIKNKLSKIDLEADGNQSKDLPLVFELQSSLITAEATIISALEEKGK